MDALPTPPDLERLLAHRGWVRTLARNLVRDPALADEVEQRAWLRALERPPWHERNLRGWLGSLVRTAAATLRREEGRQESRRLRAQVEAGTRQDAQLGPCELAERLETFRHLSVLVANLEEPYGTAIFLRFFEGWPVLRIARHMDVPVPTAQSRIRRGLEILRRRMGARLGGDWRQRCLVLAMPPTSWAATTLSAVVTIMSTKKVVAALVVLALVPLAAIVLDSGPEPRQATEVSAPAPAPPAAAADAAPEQVELRSELLPVHREGGAAGPDPPSPGPGHLIRVLDAKTLWGVPDAEVLWFDRASELDAAFCADLFSYKEGMEGILERFGERFRTDENGEFRAPQRRGYVHVAARKDGRYAADYLAQPLGTDPYAVVELLLRPAVGFTVRLLDFNGRPVADTLLQLEGVSHGRTAQLTRARTDPTGTARFANVQVEVAERPGTEEELSAYPVLPFLSPSRVSVSRLAPPVEPFELRLPPSGAVRIRVTTAEGEPTPDGTEVALWTMPSPGEEWDPLDRADADGIARVTLENPPGWATRVEARGGVASFPWVGLGLRLHAAVRLPRATELGYVAFAGPVRADQLVELPLAAAPLPVERHIRLVDVGGKLLPSTSFHLHLVGVGDNGVQNLATWFSWTNTEGRTSLRLRLPEGAEQARFMALLVEQTSVLGGGLTRWGSRSFEVQSEPRVADMGEVQLGGELFAGGVVVDPQGEGLEGARVTLQLAWWPADSPQGPGEGDFEHAVLTTGPDGRFEFRGPAPSRPEDCHLLVEPPDAAMGRTQEVELRPFAADHRIELVSGALVAGRVLLDDSVSPSELKVRVVAPRVGDWPRWWESLLSGNGCDYRIALEETDRAHLELLQVSAGSSQLLESEPFVLLESEPFAAKAGVPCVVSGWQPLDLRGRLFRHELEVVDAAQREVPSYSVAWPGASPSPDTFYQGKARILSLEPIQRVVVGAHGHGDVEVDLAGHTRVTLPSGIAVQLVLPEGLTLPGDVSWMLSLRGSGQTAAGRTWPRSRSLRFGGSAFPAIELPFPGNWTIRLYGQALAPAEGGERRLIGSPILVRMDGADEIVRQVEDARADAQPLRLPLSQAEVQEAIEKMIQAAETEDG